MSIQSRRSALYGGLPCKLLYFHSYDEFNQFHKKNSKNNEERVFILDLDKFYNKPSYEVIGNHDCGKHMLLCNNKSSSFHYLRDTCYDQFSAVCSGDISIGYAIFFERYYLLDNPNLLWIQVDKNDAEYVKTPLLKNASFSNENNVGYYYKLMDETTDNTLLLVYFSTNQSEDDVKRYEFFIEEAKEKIFTKFSETYL